MSTPREALFVALFDKLSALVGADGDGSVFRSASRVLLSWDDCPSSMCPAAFLLADGEVHLARRGLPPMVVVKALVIIYAKNDQGRDGVPSTQLNACISAIEDALQRTPLDGPAPTAIFPQNPDLTFGTTLGGLCYSCSIAQTVDLFDGFQGANAVATIPIELLTTDRP